MTGTGRLAVGGVVCFVFVALGLAASDHRDRPGSLSFALLCLLFGLFALLSAIPEGDLIGLGTVRIGLLESITVAWLLFAGAYTGRGPAISRPLLAGLAGFTLLIVLGVGVYPIVPSGFVPVLFATNFIVQSLASALGVYGLFIASRSVLVYDDLPTGGTVVVSTVALGFVCISVLVVVGSPAQRVTLDASLVVLSLVALSLLVAVRRHRVFAGGASAGHLAREQALDEMDAAVVIVDRTGRILDCNSAFEATFGLDRRRTIGRQLDSVVGPLSEGEQVTLATTDGRRECEVKRTVLTAAGGNTIGEAYRIRDVTDRRTREQRLDVLNRVLRHNLRNDLDAIHAFAETLETEPSSVEASDIGARIRDTASELSDIGSTVGRSERLLGHEQLTETSVDVGSLARDTLDRLTEQYPGTGTLRADDTSTIRTDPELVGAVLHEVVENGLEHGPGPDAHVVVEVEQSAGGIEIAIRDNGPGIPDRERAVLLEGEESPLRHGSGVGLWLVNWGLSRLGGDLTFRENEPAGSVVTLTIPGNSERS